MATIYNGGMVTVVTKSGSSRIHGKAFEFFRNTSLDARGYFDLTRPEFKQNQFGVALGGPIGGRLKRLNLFFTDYQGTRKNQGISTGNISVPTLAKRSGNFSDELTKTVSGPYLASLLSQKLGYAVTSGEAYSSVFPNGVACEIVQAHGGKLLFANREGGGAVASLRLPLDSNNDRDTLSKAEQEAGQDV